MLRIRVIAVFLLFCCSLIAQQPATEIKAPSWVSNRPNNAFKFVGVGFAEKSKGGNYQMEAKKNALYDLASEIKVDISSNSVLYTVQNNSGFNENFNSLIKLSNSDNIEGYTLVDSYENEKQYWVYYQLDKSDYSNRKAEKKRQTIAKAAGLINSAQADEKSGDFSSSLKKRIQAFGVLTPYLSEEINFDPAQASGMKNIFDLTSAIQVQLQSITVAGTGSVPIVKPYQATYAPLVYKLELKNKTPLHDFPLLVSSDDEKINVHERTVSNPAGELQIKVNSVEPINSMTGFALSPDITTLMGTDSVGVAGVSILKQFIQTSALKVYVNVNSISLYVRAVEKNFGKPTGMSAIDNFIRQKFSGQEIYLSDKSEGADYVIEAEADTQKDISSAVLEKNYNIYLSSLIINLQLRGKNGEVLYKNSVGDIYGYANTAEKAGLNAYTNPKMNSKLAEAVFFLKRKVVVY
jgi:hypothetical protein